MLIFVEGPDGSGKSTLIKQLSEKYITARVPKTAETAHVWNEFQTIDGDINIVFDRSPLTEIIYRSVYGPKSSFSLEDCLEWLKGNKIVFCDTDSAYDDAQRRGEDNVTSKVHHETLRLRYQCLADILKQSGFNVYHYDWHLQDLYEVIDFIRGGEQE